MGSLISHSPEETFAFGESLALKIIPGTVIGLVGDLGAGKTQLVKGIARAFGVTERIHSPTFSLVNIYASGRIPLFHLDFYRLESTEAIISAGLEPYLSPSGVSVVEWIDRWQGGLPRNYRQITMEFLTDTERRISYDDLGS